MHMNKCALIMLVPTASHTSGTVVTCIAQNRWPPLHLMLLWHAEPAHLSVSGSGSDLVGKSSHLRTIQWIPLLDCIRACKP